MENLRTAAFVGWSTDEFVDARVELEIVEPAKMKVIEMKITDNGLLHRHQKFESEGLHVGLKKTMAMANYFQATISPPTFDERKLTTTVSMIVRKLTVKDQ